jgi:hemerythrin-like domain-containing protein
MTMSQDRTLKIPPLAAPHGVHHPGNALALIREELSHHVLLCSVLEAIADGLPGDVDVSLTRYAVPLLTESVQRHVSLQENCLFPVLRASKGLSGENVEGVLEQLAHEHSEDQSLALEIADTLTEYLKDSTALNAETVGYLLRCFFEGYRRHAAWERLVLDRFAQRLSMDDLVQLSALVCSLGQEAALRGGRA